MNSIQLRNRLLPILSLGRTVAIFPRENCYHVGKNITHIRWFHFSSVLISDSSKIEKLSVVTNEQHTKQILLSSTKTSINRMMDTPLITVFSNKCQSLWHRIIHEFKHYYHGLKLLCTETKIACRLARQMLNGHTLTRRERKQFSRTMVDLFRLLPFSIFIIVPFMEFTLPIFLKFFPNMLPSTFKQVEKEQEDLKKQSIMKLEVVEYLQDTLEEMIFHSRKEYSKTVKRLSLDSKETSIKEMIKFSALIGNQFTLDNFHRSQLLALSKLLNLSIIGPNSYLRLKLHSKFNRLKIDDKLIAKEGIESLTDEELRTACHERGMNILATDAERLRSQLQQWLDLHIHHQIPLTILILSNVFYSPKNRHVDQRQETTKGVTQPPMPIDIDRLRMSLDQLVQQKTDWKRYHAKMNQIQSFAITEQFGHRSTTIRSKCIEDLVVHLTQTSDQQREMH